MPIRHSAVPLLLAAAAAVPAHGQVIPIDPLLQALTGRVDTLENRAANVDVSLAANVSALNNVQAQIAVDVAAIADLDARVTVNSNLIAANALRDDAQDGRLGVLEGRANLNDVADTGRDAAIAAGVTRDNGQDARLDGHAARLATAEAGLSARDGRIAGVEARATANDLRDDGQDTVLAANAALNVTQNARLAAGDLRDDAQDVRLTTNEAALAAGIVRDDAQDVRLATNETAIAAGVARDDNQDIRIAGNTAAIAAGVARDDAQDIQISGNATGLVTLRGDVEAGRAGLVRQADPAGPVTVAAATGGSSVSFAGTGGDRRLSGVAAGVAGNDAVNLGQLVAQSNATLASANAYTDRSMAALLDANERQLTANNGVLRRDLRTIASGTTAIAGLPQSFIPGKGMVGVSVGGTGGEMAVALGLSKAFAGENPLVLRGGLAVDTRRGDATYNASVGIHF